ncbi:hypothetical protein SPRG_10446 [Saprolegnia parasitica CBS 223.65]|uniref:RNA polymerase II subunit B1 CTD phosphatase RPAP2 homolog n=1 Tax=Saprolegnia parasitica (strain CBS 223.65) TaxID=695850 RepID=A0A067C1G8_SAPPC|nr:hypothetical protein SPRG_10446 [Saprolegnia parasitica CBS 223.65]KDO24368.1 hypothetical protein SPRG_10446 [Saprolegnia parasitica CBS 223.65]|eukprot:XP_012204961.1 hypothetical protein SPRG_10446 [Saprolegnia parasitica CBS 223.65]
MQVTQTDAEHATARDAFVLMSTLLSPVVPAPYLELCSNILQERHLRDVFEERAVQLRCGLPTCSSTLAKKKPQKYRISVARREVYSAREEQQFCSETCLKEARSFLALLPVKPVQMLPTIHQVFGTSKPNPLDYREGARAPISVASVAKPKRAQPKVVWSKQPGMGVVERPSQKPITIIENKAPAGPSREFPKEEHAILIEGFVFPGHKAKKATKLAKKMKQETAPATTEDGNENESDYSSESDSGTDSEMDILGADDDSSDDSDGNTDVYSAADLPLFATMWMKISEMVTPETLSVVAGWHQRSIPVTVEVRPISGPEEDRAHHFGAFLLRQMPSISALSGLPCDRRIQGLLQDLLHTFQLLRPVEAKEKSEWNAMCFLFLLVCHKCTPDTLRSLPTLATTLAQCRLDVAEMQQLVSIFYNTDAFETMVLADEMDKPMEVTPRVTATKGVSKKQCRKCRRATDVCICSTRLREESEFSDADVARMLQESLQIQDMSAFGTTNGADEMEDASMSS